MSGDANGSLIPGAVNFRDTGGLPAHGGTTRPGVLYRSGNLAHLERDGVDALRALGVRRIIDLRADEEVRHAPSRVDGIDLETVRVPLFLGSVASFFERDTSLAEMYRAMVDDSAARVIEVIRGMLAEQPVLVHCTVGKDRTGVTVALALAAAGVDEEAVIADYARTEGMLPEGRNRDIVRMLSSLHPEAVNLEELATRSPAQVMRELLAYLTEQYGSPTAYLQAHGLTDAELERLREVLVADDA
ncbi:MAG TPA: tyrosine-protein phosphatase [Microbacterium sp.]|nr:tyrosine-protein phosphatase [Microbacterium sp.]